MRRSTNNYLPRPKHSIRNSIDFKKAIEKLNNSRNYRLISLDVVSLFTNLHSYLIILGLKKKWKYLRGKINLSRQVFLDGIQTLLDSAYFKFNNNFYHQKIGSPMGGNSSPWFAEIALEELELFCLKSLKSSILHYSRYVDDCFLVFKDSDIELGHNTFNNFNQFLQFTIEYERDGKINFLDTTIIRHLDDFPYTDWYQKPTATGRYINFNSHHPVSMKKAMVYNLVDKAVLLSHYSFHNKNLDLIKSDLIKIVYYATWEEI